MKGDLAMTKTKLSSTKTYLRSMKGDLSTEKIDWAMAKGDLGKSTTKVDLGMTKVDLSEVKANMGKVKVDLNPAHSLFYSNLDITCPLSSMAGASSSIDRNPIVNLRSHLLLIRAEGDSWDCFGEYIECFATVVFICRWNGKSGQMLVQNLYEWL